MPHPAHDLSALLLPELATWRIRAPQATRQRLARLRGDPAIFCRTALPIACAWLAREVGIGGTWTWSLGEAFPDRFAILARGPGGAQGLPEPALDPLASDQQHPAPWRWDLLRLLAGLPICCPALKAPEFATLSALAAEGYATALEDSAQGRPPDVCRDGPKPVQTLLAAARSEGGVKRHLAQRVTGHGLQARLVRSESLEDDPQAEASLRAALSGPGWPSCQVLDVAGRRLPAGIRSLGRRRFLILLREPGPPSHLRLLEAREAPPRRLGQVLPPPPWFPSPGRLALPVADDPYAAVLPTAGLDLLLATRGHLEAPLPWGDLDAEGRRWALTACVKRLAAFHWSGLQRAVAPPPATGLVLEDEPGAPLDLARAAAAEALADRNLTEQARHLSAWLLEAYRAFKAGKGRSPAA